MRTVTGRRVLVTGASSGIGALAAMRLALSGARVVGTGRSFAGGTGAMAAHILDQVIERDLMCPGAPAAVVEAAVAALGGLDVLVANAGSGWSGPYESMSPADIAGMLDLNLRVPMELALAAAPHLHESAGQLLLVGSIAGKVGVAEEAAYAAAKSGLTGLADSLRSEWAGAVAVTLFSPGVVATPFFERRNKPYTRAWPKPIAATRAARVLAQGVDRRPAELYVPYWVGIAACLRGGLPGPYRLLSSLPNRARRGRL